MDPKILDRCLSCCKLVLFLSSSLVLIACHKTSAPSKPLIQYGTPATTHKNDPKKMDHKWVARLLIKSSSGTQTICTGSLFTDRHVLTTAHCVLDVEKMDTGTSVTFGYGTPKSQTYRFEKIDLHPNLKFDSKQRVIRGDLAIVTLNRSVDTKYSGSLPELGTESDDIRPLQVNVGLFTVFGYGKTETDNPSNQLLSAELNAFSILNCHRSMPCYSKLNVTEEYPNEFFGAVRSKKESNISGGDSGGPAVIWNGEKPKIVGVTVITVSYNPICLPDGWQPGSLAFFQTLLHPETKNWIESIVKNYPCEISLGCQIQ